jgi:hypothetical protein
MWAALQANGPHQTLLRQDGSAGHGTRDRAGRLAYFADALAFGSFLGLPRSRDRGSGDGEQ